MKKRTNNEIQHDYMHFITKYLESKRTRDVQKMTNKEWSVYKHMIFDITMPFQKEIYYESPKLDKWLYILDFITSNVSSLLDLYNRQVQDNYRGPDFFPHHNYTLYDEEV